MKDVSLGLYFGQIVFCKKHQQAVYKVYAKVF